MFCSKGRFWWQVIDWFFFWYFWFLLIENLPFRTVSISVDGIRNGTSLYRQYPSTFVLNHTIGASDNSTSKPEGILAFSSISGDPEASSSFSAFGVLFAQSLTSNVTAAYLQGPASKFSDGPVIATICGDSSAVRCNAVTVVPGTNLFRWTQPLPISGLILDSLLFNHGLLYVKLHTVLNPSGELRGQLEPRRGPPKPNVPSFALDQATANARDFVLKPFGNVSISREENNPLTPFITIYGYVSAQYLSSAVTAVHFHGPASKTSDGPVVATICGPPSNITCNSVTGIPHTNTFAWLQMLPSVGINLNRTLVQNGLYYQISTLLWV